MPHEDKRNPTTGTESDISKAQSPQQPTSQAKQQTETGQQGQQQFDQDRAASAPDEGLQGETLAQQRTDIEGTSQGSPERAEEEGGFVGSESDADSSSELVEDQDLAKGGQGAPEGK